MFITQDHIKVHFIGIGGIGMSGIAEVLVSLGYQVSGSDLSRSGNVKKLESLGAEIFIGHQASNVKDATVIVYSSAIDHENEEIQESKKLKIPLMRRAEMLAELMRLKHGIAIAGTHGKTTTTSFLATILEESNLEPTYIIGGIVENLKGHAKVGKGQILVAEADESDGSFLLLNPIMSVVTNIDDDHLDHYGSEEALLNAFESFMNKVPFYGRTAFNIHDKKIRSIRNRLKKPSVSFGVEGIEDFGSKIDFEARNISYENSKTIYDLYYQGKKQIQITINLPGRHNVLNSLGAIVMAFYMNVSFDLIATSIQKFKGVGRRFENLFAKDDFELIDDYGHHPTEIAATLKTLKDTRGDKKIIAIFEPHRFTRTKDCWSKFLHSFNNADKVYICPIYAASERPIAGINSKSLVKDINRLHPGLAENLKETEDLKTIISKYKKEDVSLVTLGAGSIGRIVREWRP